MHPNPELHPTHEGIDYSTEKGDCVHASPTSAIQNHLEIEPMGSWLNLFALVDDYLTNNTAPKSFCLEEKFETV